MKKQGLIILMLLLSTQSFATHTTTEELASKQNLPKFPLLIQDLIDFSNDRNGKRDGFEIGNHFRWLENIAGMYKFKVYTNWDFRVNDVFTEVGAPDSDISIEIDVEPIEYQDANKYLEEMEKRNWGQVKLGELSGVRRDSLTEDGYVSSTVKLFRRPGETINFIIEADTDNKVNIEQVNHVLSTFRVIEE